MLSQDEAEIYDRQIRLWGVNAQSRIRKSKVLMLGFSGVASEVAKILVLAGIDQLTIVDDESFQSSDLTSNLFCRPTSHEAEGMNSEQEEKTEYKTQFVTEKLKTLNPLVKVTVDNSPILSKTVEDFKNYDLVTLSSFLTIDEVNTINEACRNNNIKFYIVLDYGFFGFMFNDLGGGFKFTYEEYDDSKESTDSSETIIERGSVLAEGDNTEVKKVTVDDKEEEYPEDIESFEMENNEDSDEENNRPKKKRRIHSPPRKVEAKAENEKVTKVGNLPYVTFKEMISLSNQSSIFNKNTSPVLFISIAMFQFYSQYKHLPRYEEPQEKQEDISRLNRIIVSLTDKLNLHESIFKKLDKYWSDNIYGSLSSVCAIVGGVAGQDMIRALSNKDIPINNTFSFDGINMVGMVQKNGILSLTTPLVQPVVRDFLQIDDDDDDDD